MSRPAPTRAAVSARAFGLVRHHPVLSAVTALYLGAVAWLTLGPQPIGLVKAGGVFRLLALFQRHTATAWITYPTVEFGANVAMFVPIGVFLLLLAGRRRWWMAALAGVLLSASIEFAANVAMFVPIGVFLLLLVGRRWWWLAALAGVALSASIEVAQLFLPGRVSDVRDLVSNSIGAFRG